jgi:hypothetical protein
VRCKEGKKREKEGKRGKKREKEGKEFSYVPHRTHRTPLLTRCPKWESYLITDP